MDPRKFSYIFGREPSVDRMNRPSPTTQLNLETRWVNECDRDNGSYASCTADDLASVFLRLRPIESCGNYVVERNVLKLSNPHGVDGNSREQVEKNFTFSSIFTDAKQRDIYETCVLSSIEKDESLTILTYGTSGAGKTYTLMGSGTEQGILPRALEHIFARFADFISSTPDFKATKGDFTILDDGELVTELNKCQQYFGDGRQSIYSENRETILSEHQFIKLAGSNTIVYTWISFIEIYNENVHDLLDLAALRDHSGNTAKKRTCLKVMSNDGKTFVKDLSTVFVTSCEEALKLFSLGLENRSKASTNINDTSSRSHCIFVVDILKYEESNGVTHTTYKFCDLAGSERSKKAVTVGTRLKEAQNINTSLMVLGRCLDTVYNNQRKKRADLVPFRDSKLTLFLQAQLVGKEKLTMIVNILPNVDFYEENLHVLNFSALAKEITYQKPIKEKVSRSSRFSSFLARTSSFDYSDSSEISLILDENYRLKERIKQLEDEQDVREREIINMCLDEQERRLREKEENCERRAEIRLANLRKQLQFEIDMLEKEIAKLRDENDDLIDENEEYESESTELKRKNAQLTEEISRMKAQMELMEARLQPASDDVIDLDVTQNEVNDEVLNATVELHEGSDGADPPE